MFTNSRRISCGPVSTAIPQILFFNVFFIQFCVKWHQSQFSALPVTKEKKSETLFLFLQFPSSWPEWGLEQWARRAQWSMIEAVGKLLKIDDVKSDSYFSTFKIFKAISNQKVYLITMRKFILPHCWVPQKTY